MEQGFPITSALFSCMPLMKPCLKLAMLTYCLRLVENGAPDRIRTCDLWNRNPTLYPAELRVHPKAM